MNYTISWGWRLSVLLAFLCFAAIAVSFHNSIDHSCEDVTFL